MAAVGAVVRAAQGRVPKLHSNSRRVGLAVLPSHRQLLAVVAAATLPSHRRLLAVVAAAAHPRHRQHLLLLLLPVAVAVHPSNLLMVVAAHLSLLRPLVLVKPMGVAALAARVVAAARQSSLQVEAAAALHPLLLVPLVDAAARAAVVAVVDLLSS